MPNYFFNFETEGQTIRTVSIPGNPFPVRHSAGCYLAFFNPIDDIWDQAEGKAYGVFVPNQGVPVRVPLADYQCEIPKEVLNADWFQVGAIIIDGNRAYPTTLTGKFIVRDGTITLKNT